MAAHSIKCDSQAWLAEQLAPIAIEGQSQFCALYGIWLKSVRAGTTTGNPELSA